jgi:hypothetical protein
MRAVSIIIRFVQLLAIMAVVLGISNAGSFFELLIGLAQGQPWDFAEFAKLFAAFLSPAGLGVGLIVGLELMLRQGRMTHARSLRFPEQPWLWKPMWAERRIRLTNRTPIAICLTALGIFGFVMVPVGLWMASHMPATPVSIFLGLTGLLVLALMRMTWLNRRFGRSELEILTLPGVIGGPFRGTVTIPESFPDGTTFRVTLKCICHRTSRMRPSGETHSVSDTIWQDQKILVKSLPMDRPNAVAIPCSFAIPFSCEPTSLNTITFSPAPDSHPGEDVSIHWQLSVGKKEMQDLRAATFDVPVFKTISSSPDYKEDVSVDAAHLERVDVDEVLESIPIQREYSASGERLRITLFRTRAFFLLLAFALAVSLGAWAIFYFMTMPLALFAGVIPGAMALISYWIMVMWLTWKAEIEITEDATTFTAGYIWSRRRYEFPRGKQPTLECHEEFRRESGNLYCVRLVPLGSPPCAIIKRLDSKQSAIAVRNWLVKQLGQNRARVDGTNS